MPRSLSVDFYFKYLNARTQRQDKTRLRRVQQPCKIDRPTVVATAPFLSSFHGHGGNERRVNGTRRPGVFLALSRQQVLRIYFIFLFYPRVQGVSSVFWWCNALTPWPPSLSLRIFVFFPLAAAAVCVCVCMFYRWVTFIYKRTRLRRRRRRHYTIAPPHRHASLLSLCCPHLLCRNLVIFF